MDSPKALHRRRSISYCSDQSLESLIAFNGLEDDHDITGMEEIQAVRRPRWMFLRARRRPWHMDRRLKGSSCSSRLGNKRKSFLACFCRILLSLFTVFLLTVLYFAFSLPSYTYEPQHYTALRARANAATEGGANLHDEKIFIAASLHDDRGELLGGDWARNIERLITYLGPNNVFLSIYENDADDGSVQALREFGQRLRCNSSLRSEHIDLAQLPHVQTPEGMKLGRIEFLAHVRNRALGPLHDPASIAYGVRFDKVLYVNDVLFDPLDAANLVFSTNVDKFGRTNYRAACAVDFIHPFKLYDTYATRDTEGYTTGVPIYPWFANVGAAISRGDVLAQKDAVRVKSCWGGMVSFEAKWFQPHMHIGLPANTSSLQFRAEQDVFWEASECCLVHADLVQMLPMFNKAADDVGIYMNPYVRAAYRPKVQRSLRLARRFERLLPAFQRLASWIGSMPRWNPRREEQPGDRVVDSTWVWNAPATPVGDGNLTGSLQDVARMAKPGQFCGVRQFTFVKENAKANERYWGSIDVPIGG